MIAMNGVKWCFQAKQRPQSMGNKQKYFSPAGVTWRPIWMETVSDEKVSYVVVGV